MTSGIGRAVAVCALALGAVGAVGCGSARPVKYYELSPPSVAALPPTANAYPVTLLVGPLAAPELYRGDDIVYRTGPQQLGVYEYHRWAESPAEMIEANLLRRLRESGRYRAVQLLRSNVAGDFVLRGRLDNLEELDGPPLAARVSLVIELDNARTGQAVWWHSYTRDEPVVGKDVSAVVAALNRNVQQGLTEIVEGLNRYFSAHPPK